MKGFSLKKAVSPRILLAMGLGTVLWISVFFLSGPSELFVALSGGITSFGMVLGLSAAALAFRATAWKIALSALGHRGATLASVLSASLGFGGTPIKLALLRKKTGINDGAGSIALDRSVEAFTALIFTGSGLFLGFLLTPGNALVRGLMLILAVGGFGYVVIVTQRGKRKRRGFFTSLPDGGGRLARRILSPAVRGRFEERDRFFSWLRLCHSASFQASLLIHLTAFGLSALEVLAIGRAIDPYFPPALALALPAAMLVFRAVFFFVPAALGFLEATVAGVVGLTFGVSLIPVGVAIVILLRLRTLAWWGIGLAVTGNPVRMLFGR